MGEWKALEILMGQGMTLEEAKDFAQQIVRAPSKGETAWVIASRNLVGVRNHFYGGRTQPCDLGSCKMCEAGHPWRWHAYLSVWNPKRNMRAILEMPAAAAATIAERFEVNGTLRGQKIQVWRLGETKNGRVQCSLTEWK